MFWIGAILMENHMDEGNTIPSIIFSFLNIAWLEPKL